MSKFNSRVSVFELADAEAIKAQSDDGGAFTDESTAANNAIANDMTLLPAVEMIDDAYYLGSLLATFDGVVLDIGTSGVGNTVVFEYGTTAPSTYSALTVSDETAGLTAAVGKRLISFAAPSDWVKTTVNTIEGYWIRIRCTVASFTTQPLGTEAWLVRNIAEYITDASGLPGERELIDTSTLGDSGRTRSPSLENAKISISGCMTTRGTKGQMPFWGYCKTTLMPTCSTMDRRVKPAPISDTAGCAGFATMW